MILISTIYLTYHFSQKHLKRWQERIQLERTASLCMNRIARDLQIAQYFWMEDNEFIVKPVQKDSVYYVLQDSVLYRNRVPVNNPDVLITDMQIQPFVNPDLSDDHDLQFPESSYENHPGFQLHEIRILFQGDARILELRTTVYPRNQSQESIVYP